MKVKEKEMKERCSSGSELEPEGEERQTEHPRYGR